MDKILQCLLTRIERTQPSLLVTIIKDAGSAPRGQGANMVVGAEGLVTGSIGGGMLEFRTIDEAKKMLSLQQGGVHCYGLTKDAVAGLGMVCGGNVEVLFTYVENNQLNKQIVKKALTTLASRQAGWLLLPCDGKKLGFVSNEGILGMDLPIGKTDITAVEKSSVLKTKLGDCYIQKIQNSSRVFVFGGGHLAQETVPLLSHLGFRCIVTDDRPEFSTRELFPTAEAVYTRKFTALAGHYEVQPTDYIVAVTRGHVGDFDVQLFALKTPACYIGVVGSRTKIATVNAKLHQAGFTDRDIKRITAPIGLDIGSETPAEIAVSIAAQLIQIRANLQPKE